MSLRCGGNRTGRDAGSPKGGSNGRNREIKGMGRRDFLKTAALSGLALGGAAALTGCAPSTGAEKGTSANASAGADVAWDKEVDVLVIGSGTGAFAALVAAAKGAESVCLVEKGTMWGGTAATSGGGLAVPLTYAATDASVSYMDRCWSAPTILATGDDLSKLPAHTLPFGGFVSAKPPPLLMEGRRFNGEYSGAEPIRWKFFVTKGAAT